MTMKGTGALHVTATTLQIHLLIAHGHLTLIVVTLMLKWPSMQVGLTAAAAGSYGLQRLLLARLYDTELWAPWRLPICNAEFRRFNPSRSCWG